MKKIRIDYYHYRIKKGRVDILLQRSDSGRYCIPYHYVMEEEKVCSFSSLLRKIEDDGDMVLLDKKLNNSHLRKEDKDWVPLTDITGISFSLGVPSEIIRHSLSIFLDLCPSEEAQIHRKIESILENELINAAKAEYVEELRNMLNGTPSVIWTDAYVSPPNPDLLKEEIETLEHFHLCRHQRDGSYQSLRYHFESIDWRLFGSKIEFLNEFKIDDLSMAFLKTEINEAID